MPARHGRYSPRFRFPDWSLCMAASVQPLSETVVKLHSEYRQGGGLECERELDDPATGSERYMIHRSGTLPAPRADPLAMLPRPGFRLRMPTCRIACLVFAAAPTVAFLASTPSRNPFWVAGGQILTGTSSLIALLVFTTGGACVACEVASTLLLDRRADRV
ncbi:hypothetical protein BCR34DRAFT_176687 [Clohesyomyces aquaticus]|uniref:Uncharacterized protein n=1 Tax=Clohesyomyces aquaticus TaxID=1231657 RepID=A0A1Y1YFZ3_9PLEO|nr:hypothetical protein BCR34DRAFT_176687 [Clohesyomyces aquaticus]